MKRALRRAAAAAALWLAAAVLPASDEPPFPGWLAGFSFEADEDLDTGPDSLRVFERGRGEVALGQEFRISGTTAVVLRDVADDGDFPELLVFFDEQRSGKIWLHFAFLLTSTEHELNIGLAGPAGFGLGRDGLSFWLALRPGEGGTPGWLVHLSDSIPRKLFRPRPFTWSIVDVVLDLDAGTYDLVIQEEGRASQDREPLVELHDQPTVAGHRRVGIDKFSFIGDRGSDESAVEYWIDDVVVATERPVELPDFLAPGRRRLFVERLSALVEIPARTCPPVLGPQDFAPRRATGESYEPEQLGRAWESWSRGCAALERGDFEEALPQLADAASRVPESMAYTAATVLASMASGRVADAEAALVEVANRFQTDPRYPLLVASVAEAHQELDLAAEWLRLSSDDADPGRPPTERDLSLAGYYGLLLRTGEYEEAWDVADALARRFAAGPNVLAETLWWERAGDAAYLAGSIGRAQELYRFALDSIETPGGDPAAQRLWLKLSDVLWSLGDLEGERELRERIYGRLD